MSGERCCRLSRADCSCCSTRSTKLQNQSGRNTHITVLSKDNRVAKYELQPAGGELSLALRVQMKKKKSKVSKFHSIFTNKNDDK